MIGKSIKHYRILKKLGVGGMGEVYLAEDTKLKRSVALKFLPQKYSRDPIQKIKFMEEARSSSSLDHNNICVIYEVNETDDGQLFICMNYCKGENLEEHISNNNLSIKRIVRYITHIAKGLNEAHKNGIIHCDIKPSNIIIANNKVAKIVDFGIAKLSSQEKIQKKDSISGTIAYMSPEQLSNSTIDARSDIWSLGVIFYELLTNTRPFKDSYYEGLMYSIINEDPKKLTSLNPDIPDELEKIVSKMLKKDPNERYQNINELIIDLNKYGRIIDIPANPKELLKAFFSSKKNKKYSIVFSSAISFALIIVIYFSAIHGKSIPSIGILNMENLGNPIDDFWSRGITEDLIVNVASAGLIRVPTLNEVNRFNNGDFNTKEIAEKLRVDYLLSSSLFKKDSIFDLWCRIIDPKSGRDIFAKKWSKPIQEASAITTILAGSVLKNLGISQNKAKRTQTIVDPEAYELYLKGKNIWENQNTNNDIILARGLLNKAMEIDPNFFQANIQLGQTFVGTAEYDKALVIFNECFDIAKKFNNDSELAIALYNIGNINLYKYQISEAIEIYEKALIIVRENGDKYNEGKILNNIGSSYYRTNDYQKAKEYYNESRLISVLLDDKVGDKGEAESLFNLGSIYLEENDFNLAMDTFRDLYDIFEGLKIKSHMGYALNGISLSYLGKGNIEQALNYANISLQSAREISDKRNELYSLTNIGEINYCIGNDEEANNVFIQTSEMANNIGEIYYSALANQYLGLLSLRDGDYNQSIYYFDIADNIWKELDDPTHAVWTHASRALAAQKLDDNKTATEQISIAESILVETIPYKDYATCVYYNMYQYYVTIGDTSLAKRYLSYANDEIEKRLGYIDKPKIKNEFLDRMVEYNKIIDSYKKYFD